MKFTLSRETVVGFYIVAFVFALCLHLFNYSYFYFSPVYVVKLEAQDTAVRAVDPRFLSFGIDTVAVADGIDRLRLDSPRLRHLTGLLGPSYIRLGGTMSDRLRFVETPEPGKFLPEFLLDGDDLLKIHDFCAATSAKLLFDLNALLRRGDRWDSSDAETLFDFVERHNLTEDFVWQLGNEPNSFPHVFNVTVPPERLAADFVALKGLLRRYSPGYRLVGPDTTRPQTERPEAMRYMKDFLDALDGRPGGVPRTLDAIAWHQYYLNGRTATVDDFWNPDTYGALRDQLFTMKFNVGKYLPRTPMWLSETSSAYGGGAPGLSDTFASSPLWLDKMGLAAAQGVDVLVRQSLVGAHYNVITQDDEPTPDWWVSYVYRSLVGREVIACTDDAPPQHRIYCHCAAADADGKRSGSVTLFAINLADTELTFQIVGSAVDGLTETDEYVLTSESRDGKETDLNGRRLRYRGDVPELTPVSGVKTFATMPARSLGFFVLRNVKMKACQ